MVSGERGPCGYRAELPGLLAALIATGFVDFDGLNSLARAVNAPPDVEDL